MTERAHLILAEGRPPFPMPDGRPFPAAGLTVAVTLFWQRRIAAGDVITDPAAPASPGE